MRLTRLTACILAMFLLGSVAAELSSAEEVDVYGTVDRFVWQEFSDNDARLLRESGTLLGLGVDYRQEFPAQVILDASGGIFGGRVGYDGSTQGGDQVLVSTNVDYLGLKLKGDVGRTFRVAGPCSLEPFAGLGIRAWMRHIENSNGTTQTGQPVQVSGYTEQWTTLHARLGARGDMEISQTKLVFIEAGVKLPLYNENTAYLSTTGLAPDVTMHPGRQPSLFIEAGIRFLRMGESIKINRVKASVFYDGMRFSRSPDVVKQSHITYQPRSTADIYGVKMGILF